ncbi:DUF2225 domain-containing protein [Lutispora thermophila]|uniref:Tetratricopeptide repeat-containing protein n=1 Tax=Lutispora thermophila DSM 19022 TaxID=1122184 RepID=A0A1M6FXW0_9FIRM|nr:DUF2225 domain-containing protein [Lutispora thermophila]SHJ02494.1 hypothetical protein SAMN02745176_02158 [Lutispora thermophila DSM 19022]
MNNAYYTKEVTCPICMINFNTTKIKTSALRVEHRDEDFCVHYENYNPIYYEVIVCPSCGYASTENAFDNLNNKEKLVLAEAFVGRQIGRNFCGIRTHKDALDSYKIAIYTANLIKAKNSYIAGLALKTAWMYRYINNEENEKAFLNMALDNYIEAFNKERFPANNMDELTVIYLIGELSRRLGNYEEAVYWFSRVTSHPDRNSNMRIQGLAREQWHAVRELVKKN